MKNFKIRFWWGVLIFAILILIYLLFNSIFVATISVWNFFLLKIGINSILLGNFDLSWIVLLALLFIIVYLGGFFVTSDFLEKRKFWTNIIKKIPLIKYAYNFIEKFVGYIRNTVAADKEKMVPALLRVCPERGIYLPIWLTGEAEFKIKDAKKILKLMSVFYCSEPIEGTGFLVVLDEKEFEKNVIKLDVPKQEFLFWKITGGLIQPNEHSNLTGINDENPESV